MEQNHFPILPQWEKISEQIQGAGYGHKRKDETCKHKLIYKISIPSKSFHEDRNGGNRGYGTLQNHQQCNMIGRSHHKEKKEAS